MSHTLLRLHWPGPHRYDPYPFGRGRINYGDDDGKPQYPFGYGLSYTRFALSDLNLVLTGTASVAVVVTVANVGERAGAEVVQVYVRGAEGARVRPLQRLEAYRRVVLQPGENQRVVFELTPDRLGYCDRDGGWHGDAGAVGVMVGSSSADLPLKATLAAAPAKPGMSK